MERYENSSQFGFGPVAGSELQVWRWESGLHRLVGLGFRDRRGGCPWGPISRAPAAYEFQKLVGVCYWDAGWAGRLGGQITLALGSLDTGTTAT
jgi:hypothetical protein